MIHTDGKPTIAWAPPHAHVWGDTPDRRERVLSVSGGNSGVVVWAEWCACGANRIAPQDRQQAYFLQAAR